VQPLLWLQPLLWQLATTKTTQQLVQLVQDNLFNLLKNAPSGAFFLHSL
jgi:hypothetical protein